MTRARQNGRFTASDPKQTCVFGISSGYEIDAGDGGHEADCLWECDRFSE